MCLLVFLLVSSLAMAGCLDEPSSPDDGGPPAASDDPEPVRSISWSMTGCRYANIFMPVAAEALQPYLPPGFVLADGAGPVEVPGVFETRLGYEYFACEEGTTLTDVGAPYEHGGYFVSVDPPDDLEVAGASAHYLRLLNLINDDRLEAWAPLGFPVAVGQGEFLTGDEAAVAVWADIAGDGRVGYAISGDELGGSDGDLFAEYMVGEGWAAVWQADYTVHSLRLGDAAATFPSGSLGAQVAGQVPAAVRGITGVWDFHDGRVDWFAWDGD